MGNVLKSRLHFDGKTYDGEAMFETTEIIFRGERRLIIPLAKIKSVAASGGRLQVWFGDGKAELELGAQAEKWAARITSPPSRATKLGVKAGMRIALVGMEDEALVEDIGSHGALLQTGARSKGLDMIFFAAQAPKDLTRLAAIAGRLEPSGAIWLIRAKGKGAPISERESMAAGKQAGLVDVKVVSYSETHSAEKYVIPVSQRRR